MNDVVIVIFPVTITVLKLKIRLSVINDGNNSSIPPTLDGWVYIEPIHGPLDGPLYTWAQYTPTHTILVNLRSTYIFQ